VTFEIEGLEAIEVLDSRGRPTVKAYCRIGSRWASASVPSGASTGIHEAVELRDGDPARYKGLGCRKAVHGIIAEIAPLVVGRLFENQFELDRVLCAIDGTPDKSRLGSNAILAVSVSVARAVAQDRQIELHQLLGEMPTPSVYSGLPRLMVNLFSGGRHAGGQVAIQDVLIVPRAESIDEALQLSGRVYSAALDLLASKYGMRELTADEGGLAPEFANCEAMLSDAVEAITMSGLEPGRDVALAIDVAASQFAEDGRYTVDGESLSQAQMIDLLASWCGKYPIRMIEDGLGEDDWDGWTKLRDRLPDSVQIIGDDLLCTNAERVRRAADSEAADMLLLKVNQAGCLTDAVAALDTAREAGWGVVVSARSGETEDSWLADFAVGWAADFIKVGSIRQSERLAKYNRLLEIESGIAKPSLSQARSSTD